MGVLDLCLHFSSTKSLSSLILPYVVVVLATPNDINPFTCSEALIAGLEDGGMLIGPTTAGEPDESQSVGSEHD